MPVIKHQPLIPALLLLGLPATAFAQSATPATPRHTETLPGVVVRAAPDREEQEEVVRGFSARRSTTATKTSTPLIETPQAASVVTRDQIEAQGLRNVTNTVAYSAGAQSTSFDNRRDTISLRGSRITQYQDGLLRLTGYDNTVRPDPYMLERVELLRGPSSVLYGQGTIGGILNLSSKKPQAQTQREIQAQFGSHGRLQLATDLSGRLDNDGQWLYRLVALGRKSGTQVDHVSDDRLLLAPSLTWRRSPDTSLTLQALHQKDNSGSLIGFFPWQGTYLPNRYGQIPTRTFISEPDWDKFEAKQDSFAYQFRHRLKPGWSVRQNLRYANSEVDYRTLYTSFTRDRATGRPARPVFNSDDRSIKRDYYWSIKHLQMFQIDTMLEAMIQTGPVQHTLLAGIDAQRSRSTDNSTRGVGSDIDVYAPVYGSFTPPTTLKAGPAVRQRQLGLYLQDQIRWQDWLLTLGARHDRARSSTDGKSSNNLNDQVWTKRIALGYHAAADWSPYLSYAESFLPLGGKDANDRPYQPQRGKQLEAGIKWQPASLNLNGYAAIFQQRDTNIKTPDPANPLNSIQAGETRSTGLELELTGTVGRWQWTAAYALTRARMHRNPGEPDSEGKPMPGVPRHSASGWLDYAWSGRDSNGWQTGLGARFANSSWSGTELVRNPRWLLFDARIGWRHNNWQLALNAINLADKVQIYQCLKRGDCFYGPRRTLTLTATYRF